jgi:hypothetical protein
MFVLVSLPLADYALSIAMIGMIVVLWNLFAPVGGYTQSPWATAGGLAIAGLMGSLALAIIAWQARSAGAAEVSIVDWLEKSFQATLEKV